MSGTFILIQLGAQAAKILQLLHKCRSFGPHYLVFAIAR